MKYYLFVAIGIVVVAACGSEPELSSIDPVNWNKRAAVYRPADSLSTGTTYLSVYSQIYSQTEHRTHNLTATVSMRNVNRADTVFIDRAEYFDTRGRSIRVYFEQTIYVAPLETVEIVIDELDREGGTGANFLFDWAAKPAAAEPLFEGIMISTSGQQGLSFTTRGERVR